MKNKYYRAIENCKRKIVFSSMRMWFYLIISIIKSLNWTNSGGTCIKVERDDVARKVKAESMESYTYAHVSHF